MVSTGTVAARTTFFSDAPQEISVQAASAVRSHHDDVDNSLVGVVEDRSIRFTATRLRGHVEAAFPDPFGRLLDGPVTGRVERLDRRGVRGAAPRYVVSTTNNTCIAAS